MYKVCHFFAARRSPSSSALARSRRLAIIQHGSIQRSTLALSRPWTAPSILRTFATSMRHRRRAYSSARAVLAQERTSDEHDDSAEAGQAANREAPNRDAHISLDQQAPPFKRGSQSLKTFEDNGKPTNATNSANISVMNSRTRATKDDVKNEKTIVDESNLTSNPVAVPFEPNPGFRGFWSLEKYHEFDNSQTNTTTVPREPDSTTTSAGTDLPSFVKPENAGLDRATADFSELWTASRQSGKIDLSQWNTLQGESKDVFPQTTLYRPFQFRGDSRSTPDRRMTKLFMLQFYNHTLAQEEISDELGQQILHSMEQFYGNRDPQHAADVLTWSWVLLAYPRQSIQRLLTFSNHRETLKQDQVPLWVILQVLRAEMIDGVSLGRIITFLAKGIDQWEWGGDSAMLLVVRLLRHARLTASSCIESVTTLFLELLDIRFADNRSSDLRISTLWCNRVLTLLALPCAVHPFRLMKHQQTSQLLIVQYMQDHKPQIPITREGYRAIAKLQLMHAKTEDEREWARAKALTWPPWEKRHQMGATSKPRTYQGKLSRVTKVLKRMEEAGYAPYDFELAVQILAGWDTDRSPTIQTARKSSAVPIATPWKPRSAVFRAIESESVWSARIEATRTVREAWMCFGSYTHNVKTSQHSSSVYESMFTRLLAKKTLSDLEHGALPGDGKETYPDPDLARDQVYIFEAVPSVEGLFSRMIANGVSPSSKLLTELLWHQQDLQQGLKYVSAANLEATKRKILATPEAQDVQSMARVIRELPNSVRRAYVRLLSRPHALKTDPKPVFGGYQDMSGAQFARAVLKSAGVRDLATWNVFFNAIFLHSHGTAATFRRLYVSEAWNVACHALSDLWTNVPLNFATFEPIAQLAFTVLTAQKLSELHFHPVKTTKRLFTIAATGSNAVTEQDFDNLSRNPSMLHSIPTGDSIEAMAWVLGTSHHRTALDDIVTLLYWVHAHKDTILGSGQRITRHNLGVFRFFFEGMWVTKELECLDDVRTLAQEKHAEMQRLLKEIGPWPDDGFMKTYLARNSSKVKRVQDSFPKK